MTTATRSVTSRAFRTMGVTEFPLSARSRKKLPGLSVRVIDGGLPPSTGTACERLCSRVAAGPLAIAVAGCIVFACSRPETGRAPRAGRPAARARSPRRRAACGTALGAAAARRRARRRAGARRRAPERRRAAPRRAGGASTGGADAGHDSGPDASKPDGSTVTDAGLTGSGPLPGGAMGFPAPERHRRLRRRADPRDLPGGARRSGRQRQDSGVRCGAVGHRGRGGGHGGHRLPATRSGARPSTPRGPRSSTAAPP